ncbi:chemotaxis protein CheW [Geoalkalibacter subterraneus]|uniref:chemotaxis protein CheW n=1 Tax=Geoalkalibacter subterraneus TaxID=483547 RepID=UPI000AE3F146|nr:chemotaxis protein CheW [Geoalkalibacter subterraneus]
MNFSAMQSDSKAVAKEAGRNEIQLACFRVGEELYGLDIMKIREIIKPQKLTPVPKAPPFIEGVINLRGAVIPIVDLRRRFGQKIDEGNRRARVIICSLSGKIIGLVVDEVIEVRNFTRREIQPAPQFLKGREAAFFIGVCRVRGELTMILDLERILSSDEKIDIERIRQTGSSS